MNILRIDASARRQGAQTRQLIDGFLAATGPDAAVVTRDLLNPIPHVDDDWVAANFTAEEERTAEQRDVLALSDSLVGEIEAADLLVIGLPVYNFGVPASLKAWIDQVCRARKTFAYSENGPVGLLKGKRAIVVFASGGTEMGSDIDFASGYLRHVLGFIGITDVEIVAADRHMADEGAVDRASARLAELASA